MSTSLKWSTPLQLRKMPLKKTTARKAAQGPSSYYPRIMRSHISSISHYESNLKERRFSSLSVPVSAFPPRHPRGFLPVKGEDINTVIVNPSLSLLTWPWRSAKRIEVEPNHVWFSSPKVLITQSLLSWLCGVPENQIVRDASRNKQRRRRRKHHWGSPPYSFSHLHG